MRKISLAALTLAVSTTAVSAQALPDYPSYVFSGQIGGNSQLTTIGSNPSGVLEVTANQFGSFHDMALVSNTAAIDLRFEYSCVYVNNANQVITSPTYSRGQRCPPQGAADSRFVRAVRVMLSGADKDAYEFDYECWIGYFRQNTLTSFGRVAEGQYCGNVSGGAPQEWLTKIQFRLRRK